MVSATVPNTRHPLDYDADDYAYIERPNRALLELFRRHVLAHARAPRVLDVGAGAGANARALRALAPELELSAIEPNPRAQALLREACDEVHPGDLESWLAAGERGRFDAVVLSDVIEHVVDPFALLKKLRAHPATARAVHLVSVPNYAVWYNRLRTLFGRFEYAASGLYDRTHLRFFTARSLVALLSAAGFEIREATCSPSLVQALAPWLRRAFTAEVAAGRHLALDESALYRAYARFVERPESGLCALWPELLGFQIVVAARPTPS